MQTSLGLSRYVPDVIEGLVGQCIRNTYKCCRSTTNESVGHPDRSIVALFSFTLFSFVNYSPVQPIYAATVDNAWIDGIVVAVQFRCKAPD